MPDCIWHQDKQTPSFSHEATWQEKLLSCEDGRAERRIPLQSWTTSLSYLTNQYWNHLSPNLFYEIINSIFFILPPLVRFPVVCTFVDTLIFFSTKGGSEGMCYECEIWKLKSLTQVFQFSLTASFHLLPPPQLLLDSDKGQDTRLNTKGPLPSQDFVFVPSSSSVCLAPSSSKIVLSQEAPQSLQSIGF